LRASPASGEPGKSAQVRSDGESAAGGIVNDPFQMLALAEAFDNPLQIFSPGRSSSVRCFLEVCSKNLARCKGRAKNVFRAHLYAAKTRHTALTIKAGRFQSRGIMTP